MRYLEKGYDGWSIMDKFCHFGRIMDWDIALRDVIFGPLPLDEENLKVCEVVKSGGFWEFGKLSLLD
jgi:hypothetical protein